LLKPHQTLLTTKYFTTVVNRPEDKRRRQAVFLEALQTLPDFTIYHGQYLSDTVTCRNCGQSYTAYHEKMTDVNIAVELMSDAFQDAFDVALLISADSDLTGPIKAVRRLFPRKRIVVGFPPNRTSFALKAAANGVTYVGRDALSDSVFTDQVTRADGVILQRPAEWR
jgi:uncharacterized LabA/DUF88 family protein